MQDQNLYVQNNDDRTPPGLSGEKKTREKTECESWTSSTAEEYLLIISGFQIFDICG